jgi:hypothetical protein
MFFMSKVSDTIGKIEQTIIVIAPVIEALTHIYPFDKW